MQIIQKADGFEAQKLLVLPDTVVSEAARHPLVQSLYITDIGYFPCARHHYRERPEGCDTAIFIYCVKGEGWVAFEQGIQVTIPANTLLVIPMHTPHSYGAMETNPWSIYWFHAKGEAVSTFIQDFQMINSTVYIPTTQTVQILHLFNQCYDTLLYKGYSLKHHIYVSQTMRYLLGSIVLLRGESHQDQQKQEYTERAIQYMFERIHASVTLDEIAQHIHLSKPHFIYLFKQVTGYSPIDYFLRLKIQRACQYLDLTDQSVKEVSWRIGIHDPYYFSRVFHKIMGLSPTNYRKMKKG